jgi:hypothetical protein
MNSSFSYAQKNSSQGPKQTFVYHIHSSFILKSKKWETPHVRGWTNA